MRKVHNDNTAHYFTVVETFPPPRHILAKIGVGIACFVMFTMFLFLGGYFGVMFGEMLGGPGILSNQWHNPWCIGGAAVFAVMAIGLGKWAIE